MPDNKIFIRAKVSVYQESGLFTKELDGIANQWQPFKKVYFLRGMGDVEHTVLLGFDAETGQLRGIYFN